MRDQSLRIKVLRNEIIPHQKKEHNKCDFVVLETLCDNVATDKAFYFLGRTTRCVCTAGTYPIHGSHLLKVIFLSKKKFEPDWILLISWFAFI